jgi:osmotically-inducible protein OsmY
MKGRLTSARATTAPMPAAVSPNLRASVMLLFLFGLLLAALPARAEERPTDATITYWVQNALREDSRIPANAMTVTTEDGIVHLTGSVVNLAASRYADLEAKKIKGVRGVINELVVDAPFRYDVDIAQDILQRILYDSAIESKGIRVDAHDGNVTLHGNVDSWAEAEEAVLLATETQGVKSVTDDLMLEYPNKRPDQDIRQDVQSALTRDVYLAGLPITVAVSSGVVTLTGDVGSAYQKERAGGDVRWVRNVKKVKNDLDVKWWENQGVKTKGTMPSDTALKQAVTDDLREDLRLDTSDVTVEADAGHVTLRGSVPTFHQAKVAEKDANDVLGTAWVTDLLDVNELSRSNASLLDDVQFVLNTDYALSQDFISARVKDGVVTLNGDVNTFWEKKHANEVVSRVKGVSNVVNNIKVDYADQYTDASIASRIQDALAANAETRWVAKDIKVAVDSGKVTLTGSVGFWSEYYAAQEVAFNTDGVWAVNNDLHVQDYDYDWLAFGYPWPRTYERDHYYPPYPYEDWWM